MNGRRASRGLPVIRENISTFILGVAFLLASSAFLVSHVKVRAMMTELAHRAPTMRASEIFGEIHRAHASARTKLLPVSKGFAMIYFTRLADCRELTDEAVEVSRAYGDRVDIIVVPVEIGGTELAQYKESLPPVFKIPAPWREEDARRFRLGKTPYRVLVDIHHQQIMFEGQPGASRVEILGLMAGMRRLGF